MIQATAVAPPREAARHDAAGRPTGPRMWFIVDGCGFICFMIAYSLLSVSNMVVCKLGRWPYGDAGARACLSLYEMWFVLGLWSHLACMLSDPGAVPLDVEMEEGMKQCNKCKAPKPLRAHHCSICERCIMKMDHHCPWVNNCVGARNQKHFVLFLLYVQLQCWAAVGSLGAYFVNSNTISPHGRSRGFLAKTPAEREAYREEVRRRAAARASQDWDMLCCILIFFIAIIFGLFTCIMLCDQVSNIIYNQTGIEGLQGYQSKARPWRESLQEVMGRGPSWRWLVPIAIRRAQVKDET